MIEAVAVAAATAVVNYDIFQGNEDLRRRNYPRVVTGISVAGSAAAGDCSFILRVNGVRMGEFYNKATGWPNNDHKVRCNIPVPRDALLEAHMVTAPTTNPINVEVETIP